MSHSRLSPSSANRWVECPGAVTLGEQFPEPAGRNEAADEGTASHWYASEYLEGKPRPVGSTAPNGVTITEEMIEGAMVYVEAVMKAAGGTALNIESRLKIGFVHEECFGTTDCWFVKGREVHVWDYKYGFGVVDPFENWQLICYAAGVLQWLGADDYDVVLHIVQPRPFHMLGPHRTWRVKAADLRGSFTRLATAANAALADNPPTQSGNHCKYCSARHACPAAQHAALSAVDYAGKAVAELLTPEALAIELRTMERAANAIQFRLTGLRAQAETTIREGGFVPGWALQPGGGRTVWSKPTAEVFALGDMMGIDLRGEPSAITPAQAKKKGLDAGVIAAYSGSSGSSMKLVETTATMASRVFAG